MASTRVFPHAKNYSFEELTNLNRDEIRLLAKMNDIKTGGKTKAQMTQHLQELRLPLHFAKCTYHKVRQHLLMMFAAFMGPLSRGNSYSMGDIYSLFKRFVSISCHPQMMQIFENDDDAYTNFRSAFYEMSGCSRQHYVRYGKPIPEAARCPNMFYNLELYHLNENNKWEPRLGSVGGQYWQIRPTPDSMVKKYSEVSTWKQGKVGSRGAGVAPKASIFMF